MKIYLDLVFIINTFFDFLLLLTVSIILKRKVSLKRILLVSIFSGLSIFIMFFKISSITLFIFKLLISIFMILLTFKFKNIKYFLSNLFYLYIISIFLGGFIYLLNNLLSYKNIGLIYFYEGLSINFILMFILGPIGIYLYVIQNKKRKIYNNYYSVIVYYKTTKREYIGYLDSGNLLKDFNTKLPVIFVKDKIKINDKIYNVYYKTIKGGGILKCYKVKIKINNEIKNVLINFIDNIDIDGVNCILNREII